MADYRGTSGSDTYTGTPDADTIYGYNPQGGGNGFTIQTATVATGIDKPTYIIGDPANADRLYILEKTGTVKMMSLSQGQSSVTTALDLTAQVDDLGERGLSGFAFHPEFGQGNNRKVYLTMSNNQGQTELREYSLNNDGSVDAASMKLVLNITQYTAGSALHRAGWIGFGPDGYLYMTAGEGNQPTAAQDPQSMLGKVLRLDVNGEDAYPNDSNKNFAIPDTNPTQFAGYGDQVFEKSAVYAIGFRNPWKASIDSLGRMFIGDVGENEYEEINLLVAGANYGWGHNYPNHDRDDGPETTGPYTNPIDYYANVKNTNVPAEERLGSSVTGGYVYDGPVEALKGRYIYADWGSGRFFTLSQNGDQWQRTEVTSLIFGDETGAIERINSFGKDAQGNIYVATYGSFQTPNTGTIIRLTPQAVPTTDEGDILNGEGGNDTIYGGGGNDTIYGGTENDLIYGDADNDRLYGDAGADTLNGGNGKDTIYGGSNSDELNGGSDDDHLYGDSGADTLQGGDGLDTLEGGNGNDSLEGGAGNDIYYVDSDDEILEAANGGYDVVHVIDLFYELDEGQEIEEVRAVAEVQVIGLIGNELSQKLVGNAGTNILEGRGGQDTLEGLGGNDTYVVDGNDTIIETESGGDDIVQSTVSYTLGAHLEDLQLLGNATTATGNVLNNEITGNDVANTIDGAGGHDTLIGGNGNDTYRVYGLETIEEASGEGTDTVISTVADYTLGAGVHVEVLKADLGGGWGNLTGNELDNKIYSGRNNNTLNGGSDDGGIGFNDIDTVVLSGNRADYSITLNADGSFTVSDSRGTNGDGIDMIRNVEIFEFADRKVNVANLLAPADIILAGDAVTENTKAGEALGQFRVVDNPGDTHRFELLDDAGGRFALQVVNGVMSLVVRDGVRLDYEQATQHNITVKATDSAGDSITETIAIRVADSLNESATGDALGNRILGGAGSDTFSGGLGNDTLDAGAGNDRLNGDAGNDSLVGGAGNDVFTAGDGNDRLVGGLGKDTFTGGKGRDVFVFDDRETGSSKTKADTIMDFKGREGDRLDLRLVDANTKKSGDQNFSFIGTKAFSKAGEVRYEKTKGYTYVHLNTDSDKAAEAVIKLKGSIDLSKAWFVL
jgi:Ca2+-binding RTX toxin-like protein